MRFLPVKTTNDLFIMRSDRFHLTDTYEMEDGNYIFPNVVIRDTTRTSTISTNGSLRRAIFGRSQLGFHSGRLDIRT